MGLKFVYIFQKRGFCFFFFSEAIKSKQRLQKCDGVYVQCSKLIAIIWIEVGPTVCTFLQYYLIILMRFCPLFFLGLFANLGAQLSGPTRDLISSLIG